MYWAMVALTSVMSAALALQFGGWLWSVNPRLFVVMVAITLLFLGVYISWKEPILELWRKYGNQGKKQTRSRPAQLP